MKHPVHRRGARRRTLALLLALCLSCPLAVTAPAAAAEPAASEGGITLEAVDLTGTQSGSESLRQTYAASAQMTAAVDKLVRMGIMQGDGTGLHLDRNLTRAELAALINRVYGFTKVGPTPFTDVNPAKWYADDIAIAYTAGFFKGDGTGKAMPETYITRQDVMVLLASNMRLQEIPGQVVELSDGALFSSYARGYARAAAQAGIIDDDSGNGFRPKDLITRGEMAQMVVNCVGTMVLEGGEQSLGDVFGNVTISAKDTVLQDTVIAGDLYISGGVGLGGVTLDNVTVLGRIVVAGGGEAEGGTDSIILRNVEAESLLVDTLAKNYLSLRAEGDTSIADAVLRTSCFVLDRTDEGYGLLNLSLESSDPISFTLSGNLKNVVDRTPNSSLTIAQASVANLVMSEEAPGATLTLTNDATVQKLSLDSAVPVSGTGDIDSLQVNTAGSTVQQLPDTISIRPGLTAEINEEEMDTKAAKESSADPRLLAGYPRLKNLAPTSAVAVFSTNKKGTVYWAVSAISDGSIDEEELLEPKTYGSRAVLQGQVTVPGSGTETTVSLEKLTKGGGYYLSAVLVDARGVHSPVKVVSFETPDDTVPAFVGKPTVTRVGTAPNRVQIQATTNKTCVLYYAVMSKSAGALTPSDFKTGALTGNFGAGSVNVTRNVQEYINVNSRTLDETSDYVIYLWLTDADGAKSSTVTNLTFSTGDETPPVFIIDFTVGNVTANSIPGTLNVNEAADVYWVAVPAGSVYPIMSGQTTSLSLNSEAAKIAVENAVGSVTKSGKVSAKANSNTAVNISGLAAETAYDIYYVAKDKAGNYSETVKRVTANTLDNIAPTVLEQRFTHPGTSALEPYPDTGVQLVFSEAITCNPDYEPTLLELYNAVRDATDLERPAKRERLADALRSCITLYTTVGSRWVQATQRDASSDPDADWVIDYRYATVTMGTGENAKQMTITFPTSVSSSVSALNLKSGCSYYFALDRICDTSTSHNAMRAVSLDKFTTIVSQVDFADLFLFDRTLPDTTDSSVKDPGVTLHGGFSVTPSSTSKVADGLGWDLLIWSDTTVSLELYTRTHKETASGVITSYTPWKQCSKVASITRGQGQSVTKGFGYNGGTFQDLNELDENTVYDFAFRVVRLGTSSQPETWSSTVNFEVNAVSGDAPHLTQLATTTTRSMYNSLVPSSLSVLGFPETLELLAPFYDSEAPYFLANYPKFTPGDTYVKIDTQLNRAGTVYYAIIPAANMPPTTTSSNNVELGAGVNILQNTDNYNRIPTSGISNADFNKSVTVDGISTPLYKNHIYFPLSSPDAGNITELSYASTDGAFVGSYEIGDGGFASPTLPEGDGKRLKPNTDYVCYFVIASGHTASPETQCFRFTTTDVSRPVIELTLQNPIVTIKSDMAADIDYALMVNNTSVLSSVLTANFASVALDTSDPAKVSAFNALPNHATMSVLDAMSTDVSRSSKSVGSVFDVYASESYKERAAVVIRSSTSGSGSVIVGSGTLSLPTAKGLLYDTKDCTGKEFSMSGITQYIFVAVGRNNTGEGSGDAFRAIAPVFNKDTTGPMVIASPGSFSVTNNKISGTFTVRFDSTLYQYIKSGSAATHKALDAAPIVYSKPSTGTMPDGSAFPSYRDTNSYISLMALFSDGSTGTIKPDVSHDKIHQPIEAITFTVTDAPNGAYVEFSSSLSDEYDNTRTDGITIQLNINPKYQGSVEIYISPAWDNRQKTVGNHNMTDPNATTP